MNVVARITKNLKQIRIVRRGAWDSVMSMADAKRAWEEGRIKKFNMVFFRLADNEFDVEKTLEEYRARRDEEA